MGLPMSWPGSVQVYGVTISLLSASSGGFGIIDYGNLGGSSAGNGLYNLLKTAGDFTGVRTLTTLCANLGWYIFNDNDTISKVSHEG
jgi:hypothetical protein